MPVSALLLALHTDYSAGCSKMIHISMSSKEIFTVGSANKVKVSVSRTESRCFPEFLIFMIRQILMIWFRSLCLSDPALTSGKFSSQLKARLQRNSFRVLLASMRWAQLFSSFNILILPFFEIEWKLTFSPVSLKSFSNLLHPEYKHFNKIIF